MPSKILNVIDDSIAGALPEKNHQYKLSELIALCDSSRPVTDEEQAWLDAPTIGLEELAPAVM